MTPVIGVWHDGAMHFCTGIGEQKARNLAHNDSVALTTGDVVDGGFDSPVDVAAVFRIEASEVLAFAKSPHAQTTFRR